MTPSSEDPLLTHARREAILVTCVWLIAMTYTVGYCATYGYGPAGSRELKLVLGFPDWIFWGIVTPWIACVIFGIWFSYFYMVDDDLAADTQPDASDSASEGESRRG